MSIVHVRILQIIVRRMNRKMLKIAQEKALIYFLQLFITFFDFFLTKSSNLCKRSVSLVTHVPFSRILVGQEEYLLLFITKTPYFIYSFNIDKFQ